MQHLIEYYASTHTKLQMVLEFDVSCEYSNNTYNFIPLVLLEAYLHWSP